MADRFDYSVIPEQTMAALERYIEMKLRTGDFLHGVLTNDLSKAVSHADSENEKAVFQIVCWLHNEAPASCYGSKEKVEAWLSSRVPRTGLSPGFLRPDGTLGTTDSAWKEHGKSCPWPEDCECKREV